MNPSIKVTFNTSLVVRELDRQTIPYCTKPLIAIVGVALRGHPTRGT